MDSEDRVMLAQVISMFCLALVNSLDQNDTDESHRLLDQFLDTICTLMEASYQDGRDHACRAGVN